jgi:hypothetical protein
MTRIIALGLLLLPLLCRAADVAGVRIDDSARIGAHNLVLNGAGVRVKVFFKLYAAGLYLTEKTGSAAAALSLAGPKRVSMTMMRDLSAQQLIDALNDAMRNNHTPAEFEQLKPRAERLNAIMATVGAAKSGSVITLDYLPETGTRLTLNGEPKGDVIAGEDFYRALLRIWLGDDPVDGALKKALLGQGG